MLDTNTITEEERLSGFTDNLADTGTFTLEQLDKYPGELPFALPSSTIDSDSVETSAVDETIQTDTTTNSIIPSVKENKVQSANEVSLDDAFLESLKADVEASKQRKEAQQGKTDSISALRQQLESNPTETPLASQATNPIVSEVIDDINLDEDVLGDIHEVEELAIPAPPLISNDIPPIIPEVKNVASEFDLPDVPELEVKTGGLKKWLVYSSAATVAVALLGGGAWWKFSGSNHSTDSTSAHKPIIVGSLGHDNSHPTEHNSEHNSEHTAENNTAESKQSHDSVHGQSAIHGNEQSKEHSNEHGSNSHKQDVAHSPENTQSHQVKKTDQHTDNSHSKQPKDNHTTAENKHHSNNERASQPSSMTNVASKVAHTKELHNKTDEHTPKNDLVAKQKPTQQQQLPQKQTGAKSNSKHDVSHDISHNESHGNSHDNSHDAKPSTLKTQKQGYTKEIKITDSKQTVSEQKIDLKPIVAKKKTDKDGSGSIANATQQETSYSGGNSGGTSNTTKPNSPNNQISNKVQIPPFDQIRITPKPQFKTPQPSPNGVFTVQVYSSPSREDAEDWVDRLKSKSVSNTFITTQNVRGQTFYRVRFGSYSTREEAESAALKLGYSTGWVDRVR